MIAGVRRVTGAYKRGVPVTALVEGCPTWKDVWDSSRALGMDGMRVLDMQDLRAMARMRYTGVPYTDLAYIFDVSTSEARCYVRLYALNATQVVSKGAAQCATMVLA